MKKIILSVLLLGIIMGLQAQELKVINLNKPDKSRNVTLMQALNKRHSERAFANKQLWGIERSVFFNGWEKWAKGFENQRV